ncbi:hypothetical protein [Salinarimonas ramus]|nr:hypothetical protein [Salinarimonas ramus]
MENVSNQWPVSAEQISPERQAALADFIAFVAAFDPARGRQLQDDFGGQEIPPQETPVVEQPIVEQPIVAPPPVEPPSVTIGRFETFRDSPGRMMMGPDGFPVPGPSGRDLAIESAEQLFQTLPPGWSVMVVEHRGDVHVIQADGPLSIQDAAEYFDGTVVSVAGFGAVTSPDGSVGVDLDTNRPGR